MWWELNCSFSCQVDCTEHRDVCSQHGVKGYPTLLWFSGGKMVEKYASGRTLESLEEFVLEKLEEKDSKAEGTEGKVPEAKKTEVREMLQVCFGKSGNLTVLNLSYIPLVVALGESWQKHHHDYPMCGTILSSSESNVRESEKLLYLGKSNPFIGVSICACYIGYNIFIYSNQTLSRLLYTQKHENRSIL